jgi:DNA-binding transcriptional LysR family regulator
MERYQLESLLAVTDCGSFKRAAEKLYITQPAVSQAIRKLENGLGEKLLLRDRRGVRLTPAGGLFLPIARDIIRRMNDGRQAIEDLRGLRRGDLAIGAVDIASIYWLPEIFRRYQESFPDISLSVRGAGSRELMQALSRGELDLAFVFSSERPDGFDGLFFQEDRMIPVAPVTEKEERGWITYPRGSITRELLEASFAEAGRHFPVVMEIDRPEVILQLVAAGLGRAVLPKLLVDSLRDLVKVRRLRIKGLSLSRSIWLLHRGPENLSPAARSFIDDL